MEKISHMDPPTPDTPICRNVLQRDSRPWLDHLSFIFEIYLQSILIDP